MKYRIKIVVFALLFAALAIQVHSNEIIKREYPSPNGDHIIYYEGYDRNGEGTFYFKNEQVTNNILTEYLRYGPIVEWLSNWIVEIKVPTGSPNFHVYYFDYVENEISMRYDLVISSDAFLQKVACLNNSKIVIYEMFSGKELSETIIEGLEPIGFLTFCESESSFINNQKFYLKWKCPGQSSYKEITIEY